MKRYETIVIIDPDLTEEQRTPLFERLEEIISKGSGILVQNDQWGSKKLAYDIKKNNRGYYSRLDYCGTAALVDEMERVLRIDDRVLKYMTVLQSPIVELEKIEEEKAQIQAQAEEKKAQTQAPAEEKKAEPQPQAEEKKAEPQPQAEEKKAQTQAQAEEKKAQTQAPAEENVEETVLEEASADAESPPETPAAAEGANESDRNESVETESIREEQA